MRVSRALSELCCITQATLFNACLSTDDLRELGVWRRERSDLGFTPAVWCRAFLHKAVRRDPPTARRVADLLDLRYLDTVLLVRAMEPAELEELVDLWVERPEGAALPGLLWALCTDPRDTAHELGRRLCHEAAVASMRALVEAGDVAVSS